METLHPMAWCDSVVVGSGMVIAQNSSDEETNPEYQQDKGLEKGGRRTARTNPPPMCSDVFLRMSRRQTEKHEGPSKRETIFNW